ncbi:hypothetical protein [Chondromyces apiculatus]|uniref:Uncharacterized protein n=1 Tax=Chondromyces apiculatus DSM 436 TaxID=1192034 RepID=A0A017T707_9BACT|nr:hypothetical protein [Chondromyces apiculatus]EYF04807.1 Hypothetical protein CAP_3833 [Chondromyces apiculatus DSM 436]
MHELQWVDELYKAFCQTLPGMLHAEAQGLACTLGLAPSRDIPWSAVFSHGITLAAPAMLAETMPQVRGTMIQDALLAHMLAIIDAFGSDRVADGQVRQTWQLETLLAHVRRARDAAMRRLGPDIIGADRIDFSDVDEDVARLITQERGLLGSGVPVRFDLYLTISRGKQRPGIPASLALATAAGWNARWRHALFRMLESIWISLQLYDDVMDWEDDWARGGAWAVALARGVQEPREPARSGTQPVTRLAPDDASSLASARSLVLSSGVLVRLLERARRELSAARRRAEVIGAQRIAAWAQGREAHLRELSRCEEQSPGYVHRARALSAWARTVLA